MEDLKLKRFIQSANQIYIDLSDQVIDSLKKEYDYIESNLFLLDKFNTENVIPLTRLAKPINFLREDEINKNIYLDKKVALKNSKQYNEDYVIIKRIIK